MYFYTYLIFIGSGVSQAEKKAIVNKHNEVRKLIANGKVPGQPRGVNLKRMVVIELFHNYFHLPLVIGEVIGNKLLNYKQREQWSALGRYE